jgi:G6PDH family F420-dependent oxidoreductase
MRIGYLLSCEEFRPAELLDQARRAEAAGFDALWISDHFHPWLDVQGNSSFVWSMIGALSQACRLPVTTAVTCPIIRIHPAIVAQAAATSAILHEGRFVLGVGTGEALNEHILGDPWPPPAVRLEMLEEAVAVMRELWTGRTVRHRGTYYTVDHARLFTLPQSPPAVYVSGYGPVAIDLAARIGDGLVSTKPDATAVRRFREHGGDGKPAAAGFKVCYADSPEEGARLAHERWSVESAPGDLGQMLPYPEHFEELAPLVPQEATRQMYTAGPDPEAHLARLDRFRQAGYDELYVSNIGPHWPEFFDLYATRILPRFRG